MRSFIPCVYIITNTVSGKKYVGKTTDAKRRWGTHQKDAFTKKLESPLSRAIRKHGIEAFTFEVLQEFATEDEAYKFEIEKSEELVKDGISLYNIAPCGLGGYAGTKSSKAMLKEYWSHQERRDEMREKVNVSYTRPEVRERVAKKLTEAQVIEMRQMFDSGTETNFKKLGALFGVTGENAWLVVRRKIWKFAGTQSAS